MSSTRLPRPLPLIGHALHVLRDPWTFFTTVRHLGDVVKIRIGPRPAYVVNDAMLIRQVLVGDARKFGKGVQFEKLRPVLGNGLITAAGGEEHRKHRRLVQPAFHHTRIGGYVTTMQQLATERVGGWREGQRIEMDHEMVQLALEMVGRTLFNADLGSAVVEEVLRSMPVVLDGLPRRALAPTQLMERLPTAENRRFKAANHGLRAAVDQIIADYRRAGVDHGDMVSMLLLARDEQTGEVLGDTQVADEVVTMLLAGTETTANALAWALYLIGTNPDVEARLQAEVDAVVGDAPITVEHIGRLHYVRQVMSETLRCYPPGWLVTRRANEPVTLGGCALPAGASVLFSPYAVHRDPALYPDADTFDPDRWLPERAKHIPRPAFLAFGAGSRQCIGEGFAWTETAVILATVARRWRLRPAPEARVRLKPNATLAPSHLPMIVNGRDRVDAPHS